VASSRRNAIRDAPDTQIVLDASVVIAFRDPGDVHHARAVAAFQAHRYDQLVLPVSAYAEALVGPARRGAASVTSFEQFVDELALRVEPLTREIARLAARLRVSHPSLRLPDALVIATGEALNAHAVLTADAAWARVSARVQLL
jgi:predicted nucleic acid-binding protein